MDYQVRRYSLWVLMLSALFVGGCATQPKNDTIEQVYATNKKLDVPLIDLSHRQLSADQQQWLDKINAYTAADVNQIKVPHVTLVNELDQWPEDAYCSPEHIALIAQAITLNPTSTLAYSLQLHCATVTQNQPLMESAQAGLSGVADILLLTADGQTPYSAITIRDSYEAHILLQWAGYEVISVELQRLSNRAVFKMHTFNPETENYEIYYADNSEFFHYTVWQSNGIVLSNQQLADELVKVLVTAGSAPAEIMRYTAWLRNDFAENVITPLVAPVEITPMQTVLLSQAYMNKQDIAGFETQFERLLELSEFGFVDASSAFGQYLLFSDDPEEHVNASNLFRANAKSIGLDAATESWLEAMVRMRQPEEQLTRLLTHLEQPHFDSWRGAINRYARQNGWMTPKIHQKVIVLLLTLTDFEPRARLDYAYSMINGRLGLPKDVEQGVEIIREMANAGNHHAQLDYGLLYSNGRHGIRQSRDLAFHWYTKAAQQNNQSALYNLGLAYRYGRGTEIDIATSIQYFKQSFEQGFELANCRLGDIYSEEQAVLDMEKAREYYLSILDKDVASTRARRACAYSFGYLQVRQFSQFDEGIQNLKLAGELGEKDAYFELGILFSREGHEKYAPQKAVEYYQRAYSAGSARAAANLGYMYEIGNGVESNEALALKYYKLASDGGSATGQNNYATFLRYGTGIEADVNAAFALYKEAYAKGSEYAASNLGDMYYFGELAEPDYTLACDYYEEAVKRGSDDTLYDVAFCYLYGEGRETDVKKGLSLLEKSAEYGDSDAIVELGFVYSEGEFVEQDLDKAHAFFMKAYEMQNSQAAYELGGLYQEGVGVLADPVMSRLFYEQSATWGNVDAMLAVAKAYLQGLGTRIDKDVAKQWLNQAIENGSSEATELFKEFF